MRKSRKEDPFSFLRLLRLFAAMLLPFSAQAASSDPVGALRLRLRGNSDTIVSLPLHRPALLTATLTARTGNQLTLDATIPTLPAGGAYALILTGSLEGTVLSITSGDSSAVTVDASHDLASLSVADALAIIPYWTLDTVFPSGAAVHPSYNRLVPKSQIMLYDLSAVGTNRAASDIYFYFSGNGTYGAGWYRFGDMTATRGDTRLPPHSHFVVRHPAGADTELLHAGVVQMTKYRVPVDTLQSAKAQDNLVAIPVPVPVTLSESGLLQSGAFATSPNRLVAVDQLMVFDNASVAKNKSASSIYYYFAGNGTYTAGWYRFGDMSQSANDVILKPGEGYVIRKAAAAEPARSHWSALPTYLQ